jgi:hypothetical protein
MVRGEVVDHETREPVRRAAVSLGPGFGRAPALGTRITDQEGRFFFRKVPPGSYRLTITSLGYHDLADTLQVPAAGDLDILIPLSTDPIPLEPIVVTAEQRDPAMRGIRQRMESRSGFFVTREDIEARSPRLLTDLLWSMPGARVVSSPYFGRFLLLRGGCRPAVWLDRVRIYETDSLDHLVSPHNVEAIEVYHSLELPVEFGGHPCGGILIWTRMGTPSPPGLEGGWGGRFLRGVAIGAAVFFLGFIISG